MNCIMEGTLGQTKSAERVQQPTGNSLGEEDPGIISEHTPQLPDMASIQYQTK
jgi:hypothetical protein